MDSTAGSLGDSIWNNCDVYTIKVLFTLTHLRLKCITAMKVANTHFIMVYIGMPGYCFYVTTEKNIPLNCS